MTTLVQRSDASGTESTAAGWVGGYSGDNAFDSGANTKGVTGNPGMITEINGNVLRNELGFADLGYVFDTSGNALSTANHIMVLNVTDSTGTYTHSSGSSLRSDALASCKAVFANTPQTNNYPKSLDSGLYYVTNGAPSSVVGDFINFAQSPNGGADLQKAGDFSLAEVSP